MAMLSIVCQKNNFTDQTGLVFTSYFSEGGERKSCHAFQAKVLRAKLLPENQFISCPSCPRKLLIVFLSVVFARKNLLSEIVNDLKSILIQ